MLLSSNVEFIYDLNMSSTFENHQFSQILELSYHQNVSNFNPIEYMQVHGWIWKCIQSSQV